MRRKYAQDYRLDYKLTPRGNLKGDPVYCGKRFRYRLSEDTLRRLQTEIGILSGASLLVLFAMLLNTHVLDRDFRPIAIPIGFCSLPTVLLLIAWHTFRTAEPPLTRQQNDRVTAQIPISTLFQLILSALSLIGLVLQMILRGFALSWLLLAFGTLMLVALSIRLMQLSKKIETEEIEQPAQQPEDPAQQE